jgi:hypothetical protein
LHADRCTGTALTQPPRGAAQEAQQLVPARPEAELSPEVRAAARRLAVPLVSERRLKNNTGLELRPAAALRLAPTPTMQPQPPQQQAEETAASLLAAAQAEMAAAHAQAEALQRQRERLRAQAAEAGAKGLGRSAELAARLAQEQREAQERIAASLRALLGGGGGGGGG